MSKIEFEKITIKDFMSFGDEVVEFRPTESIVLGDNRDSAGADDNGSGKSTFAEAIRWAIYGQTVRSVLDTSLAVDHVVRNGAKMAQVALEVKVDGIPLTITRTRTRSKGVLVVEHGGNEHRAAAAQAVIDACIGIDVVQFSNLVHLDGSYPRLFAPSSDKDRKDILADLVEVAIAEQMRQEAVKRWSAKESELADHGAVIREHQLKKDMAKNNLSQAREAEKANRTAMLEATERVKELKEAKDKLEEAKDKLEAKAGTVEEKEDTEYYKLLGYASEAEKVQVKNEKDLQKAVDFFLIPELDAARSKIYSVEGSIKANNKRLTEIERLQARGKCPTCGQDTQDLDATERQSLTSQTEELECELEELQSTREGLEQSRQEKFTELRQLIETSRDKARGFREQANDVLAESKTARNEVRDKLAAVTDKLDKVNRGLAKKQTAEKMHSDVVRDERQKMLIAKTEIKQADEVINTHKEEVERLQQELEDLGFWKKGFGPKGVPSLFIETVLPSISKRIQKYADILTGGDVTVTLKAYRETKSNTTQESIQISAVNSKGASVYGANSTGERNRINMAVTLGLIEYFRDMGVFEADLIICDEIFDGMDSSGVEHGVRALREAAIDKTIVVSHHDHLQHLFQNVITIRKEDGVSNMIGEMQ